MNSLQVFQNSEFGQVRTVINNHEVWFVAKDVSTILGYSDTYSMTRSHVEEEDSMTAKLAGMNMNSVLINESGLYSAIFGSKQTYAKQFKKWVTSEVLPSIRKNGMYATEQLLDNPDFAIEIFQKLKHERDQRKLLESENARARQLIEQQKPKVLYAEALEVSKECILVKEMANLLKQNGIDIGQNTCFEWLRKNRYLCSTKGERYNTPTQYAMDLGLFEIKKGHRTSSDGSLKETKTPVITGKGQIYFMNKFLNSKQTA